MIALDLETTGADPKTAEIVSFALLCDDWREPLAGLCKPTKPIPKDATAIHGITNKDVEDAPSFFYYADAIHEATQGRTLMGYNIARYDVPILKRYLGATWQPKAIVDLYDWWLRAEPRKLTNCAQRFGFSLPEAHNALKDAEVCLRIYPKMKQAFPSTVETWEDKRLQDGKLTFGKHKGLPLNEIPLNYLSWLHSQLEEGDSLRRDIERHLK